MKSKLVWLTRTAALLALLIALQAGTKPFGQLVTGSCVNCVLALAALLVGLSSGAVVALLSPFFAFLLGVGPQLFPIVPAIAVGNLTLVLLLYLLCGRKDAAPLRSVLGWLLASAGKALTLYLLIVQLLCRVLALKPKQITLFTAMFSWPQLVTALIGSGLALLLSVVLKKALHHAGRS